MVWRASSRVALALLVWVAASPVSAQPSPAPQDRFIVANGLRLHYLDWGPEGKPLLVLIHGLDRHAHTFDHIAPHFVDRFHVIAVDMRGHGESAWDPDAHYVVEDYVRDLEAMADVAGWRNIVVWGNSTGGRVAQVYAGRHPDRVAKMISEDVGPERPPEIANGYRGRVSTAQNGWPSEDALLAELKQSNPRTPEMNLRTYVRHGVTRDAAGRVIWKRDPRVAEGFVVTDLWRFVERISMPALYIVGGRSTIVPMETQERLKKSLPRVQIVTVADAGHYPSDEKTTETLAIIDAFLAAR